MENGIFFFYVKNLFLTKPARIKMSTNRKPDTSHSGVRTHQTQGQRNRKNWKEKSPFV